MHHITYDGILDVMCHYPMAHVERGFKSAYRDAVAGYMRDIDATPEECAAIENIARHCIRNVFDQMVKYGYMIKFR